MRCGSALILWPSWERVQVPRGAAKVIRHHYNPSNLRSGSLSLGCCAATACHETFDIPRAACDSSLAPVYLRGIAPASFANVLQADALAKTKSAAVERLTACGRDWIVLDAAFSNDTPWERADLDTIAVGTGSERWSTTFLSARRRLPALLAQGVGEPWQTYRCCARLARRGEPGVEGQLPREVLAGRVTEAHPCRR